LGDVMAGNITFCDFEVLHFLHLFILGVLQEIGIAKLLLAIKFQSIVISYIRNKNINR